MPVATLLRCFTEYSFCIGKWPMVGISLRGKLPVPIFYLMEGESSLTQNWINLPAKRKKRLKSFNNPNAPTCRSEWWRDRLIVLKKELELGTHGGLEGTYGTRNRSNEAEESIIVIWILIFYAALITEIGSHCVTEFYYTFKFWRQRNPLNQNTTALDWLGNITSILLIGLQFFRKIIRWSLWKGLSKPVKNYPSLITFCAASSNGERFFNTFEETTKMKTMMAYDNALIFEHNFKEKGHLFALTATVHSYRNQFKTQNLGHLNNTATNHLPGKNLTGRERALQMK